MMIFIIIGRVVDKDNGSLCVHSSLSITAERALHILQN